MPELLDFREAGIERVMIYSNGGRLLENIERSWHKHPNFIIHCHCTVGVLRYLGMLTDVIRGNRNSLRIQRDCELLIVGCVDC